MTQINEIKKVFEEFVRAQKEFKFEEISKLTTEDFCADLSTIGKQKNVGEMIKRITLDANKYNVSRYTIYNPVVRAANDTAQMSAYVMSLIGEDDGKFLHSFEWGGKYVLSLRRINNSWKISKILYDLDWVKGNTNFVNSWNLIDYTVYSGHRPVISSEYDSPWDVIPESDLEQSEEDKIAEVMFKYSFGLDNCDFRLHKQSYTDDVVFYAGGKVMESGARHLINNFKNTSHKEHALQHAIKIISIKILEDGDTAELIGYRVEPHRLGSKNLNRSTLHYNFYSAKYKNTFKKIDGLWKMTTLNYDAKVFFEPRLNDDLYADKCEQE